MKIEIHNARKLKKLTDWLEDNPVEATVILVEEMKRVLKDKVSPDAVAETLTLLEKQMIKQGYKK